MLPRLQVEPVVLVDGGDGLAELRDGGVTALASRRLRRDGNGPRIRSHGMKVPKAVPVHAVQ